MGNGIDFTLIPAPNEPMPADLQQEQERMNRLPLRRRPQLAINDISISASAATGVGAHLGSMLLLAAQKAGPPLAAALATWVGTRAGRKVKIKVGDVEIEASNAKELKKLLDQAQAFKQANEPKRIHER